MITMQIKVWWALIFAFSPLATMIENGMVKVEINQYLDTTKHVTVPILGDTS